MNKIEVVFRHEKQVVRLVNPPQAAIDCLRGLELLDMAYVLRELADYNITPDVARTRGIAWSCDGVMKLKITSTLIWS